MDDHAQRVRVLPVARTQARAAAGPTMNAPSTERGRWWIEGLDAWRALAIISVLIFHLRPGTLKGGFIGVDVFFVISGFLITTLLIRELDKNGRIDLPNFWVRRARRLLPALVTVVVTSTILAFFAGGDLLVGIRRHVLGALTFSNNWVEILHGSDYFAASTPNLFMNFWSLAVEEQFYLLWPILAIIIMASLPRGRHRVILLGGAAVASAVSMALIYSPDTITRVYYGTDTHGFGLLVGAALAFAMASPDFTFFDTPLWQRLRTPLALGGFAVVIVLMITVDGEGAFAYRGGLVLASLATGAMVASLPGPATGLTKALTWAPIEWVGHRSYGIYMWHWPAILIVDAAWPPASPDSQSWWLSRAVALAATLTLAAWSYTHIENPIRKDGFKAVTARIVAWLGRIPPRGRTLVAIVSSGVLMLFAIALISAPTQSTLERSMLEASAFVTADGSEGADAGNADEQGREEAGGAEAGGAEDGGEGQETPVPESEPAPEAEAEPEPVAASIEDAWVVQPADIYCVGDSMLYVAAPGLSTLVPGVKINAESNRQWPAIRDEVRRKVEAGEVGDVVVLAGGTNAGAVDPAAVEESIEILGPQRRIVLVNIYSGSTFVEKTNENYAMLAEEHANVAVADWNLAAREHPEQLQPDRIHPNMDGMYLWAGTVTDAIQRLNVTIDLPED